MHTGPIHIQDFEWRPPLTWTSSTEEQIKSKVEQFQRHVDEYYKLIMKTVVGFDGGIPQSLHTAAGEGNVVVIRELCQKGADVNELRYGSTPMLEAVQRRHVAAMRVLAEQGANVNADIPYQGSLLRVAATNNDLEMLRALRDKGACLNEEDRQNILAIAVQANNLSMVRTLLEMGAYSDCKKKLSGFTPFHVAARRGTSYMMEALVKKGNGGFNEQTGVGETPLHFIAWCMSFPSYRSEHERKMRVLVEGGADPFIKDNNGRTPIGILEEKGFPEFARDLKTRREQYQEAVKAAVGQHILPDLAEIVGEILF